MTDLATAASELVRELRSEPGYHIVVRGRGAAIYRLALKRDAKFGWGSTQRDAMNHASKTSCEGLRQATPMPTPHCARLPVI